MSSSAVTSEMLAGYTASVPEPARPAGPPRRPRGR